ncbi:hypothetical protein KCU83_g512, partial [Aureobasidium melanogenum]
MALRIEQLVKENELQAEELRRKENKQKRKKQKKERKGKEEMAKYQTDVMRELLRAVTVVMTPMPKGSPARFVFMAIATLVLLSKIKRLDKERGRTILAANHNTTVVVKQDISLARGGPRWNRTNNLMMQLVAVKRPEIVFNIAPNHALGPLVGNNSIS